jgi:hypothetical protein
MTSAVNPLLVIFQPREIPVFLNTVSKIKVDKLYVKFHAEEEAYRKARDWFLSHDYTHFIILPDDLLITQADLDQLVEDAKSYDVISGYCRNTIRQRHDWRGEPETEETADTNVSFSLPPDPPHLGTYERFKFISMKEIQNQARPIIRVMFAGFPLTCISKEVLTIVPFRSDGGCCVDSCFSLDLSKVNIPQYCDTRVATIHMNASHPDNLLVGKRKPEIIFENSHSSISP